VLIVDDLDKIPQKLLGDGGLTNLGNRFLDLAGTLGAINCSLLLTIPIELAYSPFHGRLIDDYGAAIFTVPLVSIADRAGQEIPAAEEALIEILARRAQQAFGGTDRSASVERLFADRDSLLRVVRLSGGHVRGLLVMLTEMLNYSDDLPIPAGTVDRYVGRAARDLARGLSASDKSILEKVARTNEAVEDVRF